jgi:uncharacterized repeat protein (TIGR01451 family)
VWQSPIQINTLANHLTISPDIAVNKFGNVAAIWGYDTFGYTTIYSGYKPSGGAWSASQQIAQGVFVGVDNNFKIELDANGNAYAVWDHDYPVSKTWYTTTQPIFFSSSKTASDLIAEPDSTITYQVSIFNTLPFLTEFEVQDLIASYTTYITGTLSADQGDASINENMITWSSSIAANATLNASFDVRVNPDITESTAIINVALASATGQTTSELGNIILINPRQIYLPIIQKTN